MTTQEIRQDDSLRPTLFNIIFDQITKDIKQTQRGYTMGANEVKIICYGDDAIIIIAIIIAENEDDLKDLFIASI